PGGRTAGGRGRTEGRPPQIGVPEPGAATGGGPARGADLLRRGQPLRPSVPHHRRRAARPGRGGAAHGPRRSPRGDGGGRGTTGGTRLRARVRYGLTPVFAALEPGLDPCPPRTPCG